MQCITNDVNAAPDTSAKSPVKVTRADGDVSLAATAVAKPVVEEAVTNALKVSALNSIGHHQVRQTF